MKKLLLGTALVLGFGSYIFWSSHNSEPVTVPNLVVDATTTEPIPAVSSTGSNDSSDMVALSGQYKDGTYTGDVASTIYGDMQVAAVIKGGKIVDVKMLKYPNDVENSLEISNHSLPILKKEAIAAQSTKVDIVSGATQTVEGFQQSLGSALAQAQS